MNPPSPATAAAGGRRNVYIDTLRGWSILGVVCIHFAGSFVTTDVHAWSPSFYLGLVLNQGFIFAVPVFVFLSGLLAGSSTKRPTLGEYYLARLSRIGLPYLVVSILSFFLLNHFATWDALPGGRAKLLWLVQRLVYFGVEPTLYFIPLILQLYVLQPALRALPSWLNRAFAGLSAPRAALAITAALFVLHVAIGLLCYAGKLDYYVWGRPNPLFWMFYFFAGLHFPVLTTAVTPARARLAARLALAVAVLAMAWNFLRITDRSLVGEHFERNLLDFAYVRPEMLVYDLAVVLACAAGIVLGRVARANPFSYLGRYTLEIYLWHILVLYFGAWRYADALANCRQIPEVIVIICLLAAYAIAAVHDGWHRLVQYLQTHRLILVQDGPARSTPTP